MDLETFVKETLRQVIAGITAAQTEDGGGAVNAEGFLMTASDNMVTKGADGGVFTRVTFDVAVTSETSAGGKAGIQVFSIGAQAGGAHKSTYANRIAFSVPLRLPDGAKSDVLAERRVESERRLRQASPGSDFPGRI